MRGTNQHSQCPKLRVTRHTTILTTQRPQLQLQTTTCNKHFYTLIQRLELLMTEHIQPSRIIFLEACYSTPEASTPLPSHLTPEFIDRSTDCDSPPRNQKKAKLLGTACRVARVEYWTNFNALLTSQDLEFPVEVDLTVSENRNLEPIKMEGYSTRESVRYNTQRMSCSSII